MLLENTIKKKIDEIAEATVNSLDDVKIPGVKQGILGASLFLYHYGLFSKDKSSSKIAKEIIYNVFENIDDINLSHHPNMEIAELGWFLEYIKQKQFLKIDPNKHLAEIDIVLYNNMIAKSQKNDFDTTFGAVVNGFYFLNRINSNPAFAEKVKELVLIIAENINSENSAIYADEFGLGISHGLSGIVLFLIKCHEREILKDVTLDLIKKLNKTIWSHQNKENYKYLFPIAINDPDPYQSRYSCWSYADPGILYTLYRSAALIRDEKTKNKTVQLLETLAGHKKAIFDDSRSCDASIWYGTCGHVLLYQLMYDLTKRPLFNQAAKFWVDNTLKIGAVKSETSAAGYDRVFNFPQHYKSELSVMTGIYGIGLTLMCYLDPLHRPFAEFMYMV